MSLIDKNEPKLTEDELEFIATQKCVNCKTKFKNQNIDFVRLVSGGIIWWCIKHPTSLGRK